MNNSTLRGARSPILLLFGLFVCLLLLMPTGILRTEAIAARDIIRHYPIIPVVTAAIRAKAQTLLKSGAQFGNRRNVFSKVGDSITASPNFLVSIGNGNANLGSHGSLQTTINFFSAEIARTANSFANDSLAAHNSWTTADLLDPAQVSHDTCKVGEMPIECELRITRPTVALIMIGTNDLLQGDVSVFSANLQQILTITEHYGVIPVVSTIPARNDRQQPPSQIDTFNLAIIQVATKHHALIWNYWLALDALPDQGLESDHVHPSLPPDLNTAVFDDFHLQFGYPLRNFTALEVLDRLLTILR